MLNSSNLQAYKAQMRGAVLEPDDASYERLRKVYNAMIDKHPWLIARCADVADVIATVNFARDNAQLLAVRGGIGHLSRHFGLSIDNLLSVDVVLFG